MKERTKFIIGLFILLGTLALGGWQYNVMQANAIDADRFATEAATLTLEKNQLIEEYQEIKVDVSEARETAAQELDIVLPTDEDLTSLTRLFDDFAVKNNFSANPFFISSINYQTAVAADSLYRYVPISMSVTTSKKNLSKFLEMIESSGALEGGTRLMSVEEMNISYPEEYGGTYEVRFVINAYYSREI